MGIDHRTNLPANGRSATVPGPVSIAEPSANIATGPRPRLVANRRARSPVRLVPASVARRASACSTASVAPSALRANTGYLAGEAVVPALAKCRSEGQLFCMSTDGSLGQCRQDRDNGLERLRDWGDHRRVLFLVRTVGPYCRTRLFSTCALVSPFAISQLMYARSSTAWGVSASSSGL
jgi:hypothetical protein